MVKVERRGGRTIRRNQGFVKRRSRAPEWVVMRGEHITLKTSKGTMGDEGEGERERERTRSRKRGKPLPGFSVGLHEFATGGREGLREAAGVKRGIYPARLTRRRG